MFTQDQLIAEIKMRLKSIQVRIDKYQNVLTTSPVIEHNRKMKIYLEAGGYRSDMTKPTLLSRLVRDRYTNARRRIQNPLDTKELLQEALAMVIAGATAYDIELPPQISDIEGFKIRNGKTDRESYCYDHNTRQSCTERKYKKGYYIVPYNKVRNKSAYFYRKNIPFTAPNGVEYVEVRVYGAYYKPDHLMNIIEDPDKEPRRMLVHWECILKSEHKPRYYDWSEHKECTTQQPTAEPFHYN